MSKLETLKTSLIDNLKGAKAPVLFWSGGLDSNLILAILLETKMQLDIFQSRDGWTKEQKQFADDLIKKHKLRVYSYPSKNFYFIGEKDKISLVFEYAIGNVTFPQIRDVVNGTDCIADLSNLKTALTPPIRWDLHIIGTRKDDRHYATGTNEMIQGERFEVSGTRFYAPLYNWTKPQVKRALKRFGFDNKKVSDTKDGGNYVCCSKCLRPSENGQVFCPKENDFIPIVKWDKDTNTRLFRERYGFINQEQ